MLRNLPTATKGLLIANVAMFLLGALLGGRLGPLFDALVLHPIGGDNELDGVSGFMPWQLVTYAFLHDGLLHLFFNMLGLVMFGAPLEYTWGRTRFLRFYAACVVGAALCQLAVGWWMVSRGGDPASAVGASGGVLGLVLAYGLMFPQQKLIIFPIPFFIPARVAVGLIAAFALIAGVTGWMPGIAHAAHLGGMLTGWLLLRYWRGQPPFGGPKRRHLTPM